MKNLIIAGAGDAGRETLEYAKQINQKEKRWSTINFINDCDTKIEEKTNNEHHILGTIKDWNPSENEEFVVAISNSKGRKKVVELLLSKGANIINFIPSTVVISDYVTLGKGVYLGGNVAIGPNAVIEDYVFIQAPIPHDAIIHSYATVYASTIGGGTEIGEGATIGSGAVIAPRMKIGEHSVVGIGSVVVKNVRKNITVFGNPAKAIDI